MFTYRTSFKFQWRTIYFLKWLSKTASFLLKRAPEWLNRTDSSGRAARPRPRQERGRPLPCYRGNYLHSKEIHMFEIMSCFIIYLTKEDSYYHGYLIPFVLLRTILWTNKILRNTVWFIYSGQFGYHIQGQIINRN